MVGLTMRARARTLRKVWRRGRILMGLSAALAACAPTTGAQAAVSDDAPYLLGIFPHLTTARLEEIYAPIAADISRAVGRRVLLRTRSSFEAFMQELERERYDIALIQPFDYIHVREHYGVVPLARRASASSGGRSRSDQAGDFVLAGSGRGTQDHGKWPFKAIQTRRR